MDNIRIARDTDLPAIAGIYNHAVRSKYETAEVTEWNATDKQIWLTDHAPDLYPVFVFEKDEKVLGWSSITPYRKGRQALLRTVEISYYIHKDVKRQGIGTRLVIHTLEQAKQLGYKVVFAVIIDRNEASINLLKKLGFETWGHLQDVADFSGDICGHYYLGLKI